MSEGSKRVSFRLGRSFQIGIENYLGDRERRGGGVEKWSMTDFLVQAILDKLNHVERSRRSGVKWSAAGVEGEPRRLIRNPGHKERAAALVEEQERAAERKQVRDFPEMTDEEYNELDVPERIG